MKIQFVEFGRMFKRLRENSKLSQTKFAKSLGYTSQFISNIEKGKALLPAKKIKTAAKLFNIEPKQLASAVVCAWGKAFMDEAKCL